MCPNFSAKKKNVVQPTRIICTSRISWNIISDWLPIIFHFGTENWEEQLKKHPVYILMREKNYTFFSGSSLSYYSSRQYRMKMISKGLSDSSKVNSSIFICNIQIVDQDLFKDHFCLIQLTNIIIITTIILSRYKAK